MNGATARVLWYWPFARSEEIDLVPAFARGVGELTVQIIDRDVAPSAGRYGTAEVVRDLPDIDRSARGLRWVPSRVSTYIRRVLRREAAVRRLRPEIVHYHFANRFTDWLRRPADIWILSVHDVEPHQPRLGRLERPLLRRLYAKPDALIVHHPWLAERLTDDFGVDPTRIHVVPLQVFPVDRPVERSTTGRPMILFFGALRPNKGIPELVRAMDRPEAVDFDLHIAGRGSAADEAKVAALAADRPNVTAEIGFATPERKDELFRAASVIVMPYTSFASQSAVLHDAYGHGRPVVVTDVGALGATVRHDRTGRVVPVGDEAALVDAIAAMAGPEGDEAALAAREVAATQGPEQIAARLHQVYADVAAASARATPVPG